MTATDLFPGMQAADLPGPDGARLHLRHGGQGPPLLLLHGHPQTHAIWHRVAPTLAQHFRLIMPDLRGYGDSSKPDGGDQHAAYSKRAMAQDMVSLMQHLGFERFAVLAHDRGARVAHRLEGEALALSSGSGLPSARMFSAFSQRVNASAVSGPMCANAS